MADDREVCDLDGIPVRPVVRDNRLRPETGHLPASSSEFLDLLTAAMSAARPKISEIKKTTKGAFGRYAPLDVVLDAVTPALSEHGLVLRSRTIIVGDEEWLVTTLSHTSGQFERSMSRIAGNPGDYQKRLAAATYLRRMHTSCLCGVAADSDEDGAGLAPEKPRGPTPFELARKAISEGGSPQFRAMSLARAAASTAQGRITEAQFSELKAIHDSLLPKEETASADS
jgi:hypothetical protein